MKNKLKIFELKKYDQKNSILKNRAGFFVFKNFVLKNFSIKIDATYLERSNLKFFLSYEQQKLAQNHENFTYNTFPIKINRFDIIRIHYD